MSKFDYEFFYHNSDFEEVKGESHSFNFLKSFTHLESTNNLMNYRPKSEQHYIEKKKIFEIEKIFSNERLGFINKAGKNHNFIGKKKKKYSDERNSTKSDTIIINNPFIINNFESNNIFSQLPDEGIYIELNEKLLLLENSQNEEIPFYFVGKKILINQKVYYNKRKKSKEYNTRTLNIDNENFKSNLKKFIDIKNLESTDLLHEIDRYILYTYYNLFEDKEDTFDNFLSKINYRNKEIHDFKNKKINPKKDKTFRNESINSKIMTHSLMFLNLILSVLTGNLKDKITLKDRNKKSNRFIKKLVECKISEICLKYSFILIPHINPLIKNILQLELSEIFKFYFQSLTYKLMIYQNSFGPSEDSMYYIYYSKAILNQSSLLIDLCNKK